MMNIIERPDITNGILIADVHFGVRSSSEEWQENQKNFFSLWLIPLIQKIKNESTALFVLGDIFDDRKSINIAVNDMAISVFTELGKIVPVIIINGNHDLYKKTNNSATSLRSLENIENVSIITESCIIKTASNDILCVPYLGDIEKECNILRENTNVPFAFMHTDLSTMKYDNYREIRNGVNVNLFNGRIYSGHIHKMQETKKCVYVGAPYQMNRGNIGDKNGAFHLDFLSGNHVFYQNDMSPIFKKIDIECLMSLKDDINKLKKEIDSNYVDILVKEEDLKKKYKASEIYEIADKCLPKKYTIQVIPSERPESISEETINETNIEDLVISMIENSDESSEVKSMMKEMSSSYFKEVQQ